MWLPRITSDFCLCYPASFEIRTSASVFDSGTADFSIPFEVWHTSSLADTQSTIRKYIKIVANHYLNSRGVNRWALWDTKQKFSPCRNSYPLLKSSKRCLKIILESYQEWQHYPRPDAITVVMPKRRVPISVCLKEELRWLTKLGVIEPVERPSPWISSFVLAKSKMALSEYAWTPVDWTKHLCRNTSQYLFWMTCSMIWEMPRYLRSSVFIKYI